MSGSQNIGFQPIKIVTYSYYEPLKSIEVKYLLFGIFLLCVNTSCSEMTEEGFIGEWEGKTERVNSDGKVIEVNIACIIKSISGTNRNVMLSVSGTNFDFEANEEMDMLLYKDRPLGADSTVMTYISGSAELLNDTLLHFEHEVYAKKGTSLLYSDRVELEMTRK